MEYKVKVTIKDNVSDKEKTDRIQQFQNAFVTAAVDYYSNGIKKVKEEEKSA